MNKDFTYELLIKIESNDVENDVENVVISPNKAKK